MVLFAQSEDDVKLVDKITQVGLHIVLQAKFLTKKPVLKKNS